MCPHKMCFSVLLIAAAGAAGSAPGRIGVSRVSLASGDVWRFTRDGEVIAWPIGHNHPHSLWDPCDPGDAQCLENDLFHSKYGGDIPTAAAAQLKQYAEWGFNAAGYDAPIEHWEQLPFMTLSTPLDQPGQRGPSCWRPGESLVFPDPWDAAVIASFTGRIRSSCNRTRPYAANLLGTIWTDTPAFDIRQAQAETGRDWVSTLRCRPTATPGRMQYAAFLARRYGADPAKVCAAYDAPARNCSSWAAMDLCGVRNVAVPTAMTDDYDFLPQVVEQYYRVGTAAFRGCDPAGLLFGDTILTPWTPDAVIKVIAGFVDVISYQPNTAAYNATEMERVHRLAGGKPMLIADIGFGFPHSPPYNRTEWQMYRSQADAGAAYRGFLLSSVRSGYVIALNKCEYIDRAVIQPTRTLKPGTLDFDGTEHAVLTAAIKAANAAAQQLAAAAVSTT